MARSTSGTSDGFFFVFVFLCLIIVPLAWLGSYALTDESKAIRAVEDVGYTDVEVVDKSLVYPLSVCAESDSAKFTVIGTTSTGEERTLTVCAGVFKGATVRSG